MRLLIIGTVLTLSGLAAILPWGENAQTTAAVPTPTVGATTETVPSSAAKATTMPPPAGTRPHIMVIVEENHSYDEVIGNPAMPFFNSLAAAYGVATNYIGVSHPSEPNYLAMVSGSTWNNPHDLTPQDGLYPGRTVVDQLAFQGTGWKAYMEDMPSACDLTSTYSPGGYDVNHNPFMYFSGIRGSSGQCRRVVPFSEFATDLKAGVAPPFMFVAPNTTNDMHDGTYRQGDAWLALQFKAIFASDWYRQGGTVVVTFDEGESSDRLATVAVSAANRGASPFTARTNHYGLLRGIEEAYGVPLLGAAGDPANGDLKPLLTR